MVAEFALFRIVFQNIHTIEFSEPAAVISRLAGFAKKGDIVRRKAEDKVATLQKRADEMKVALEAVQLKQRQQEKADDHRVKALIGAAMVASVESGANEDKAERKAYISDVLTRNTVAESARAFLRVKGWI